MTPTQRQLGASSGLHEDRVCDFCFPVQAGQPPSDPEYLNSFATVTGRLNLKFTHQVIAVEEFLFEQTKRR